MAEENTSSLTAEGQVAAEDMVDELMEENTAESTDSTDSSDSDLGVSSDSQESSSSTAVDPSSGSSGSGEVESAGGNMDLVGLLSGLSALCQGIAKALDAFIPEASDPRFKELEEGALKDTGITAQTIVDISDSTVSFLTQVSEILDNATSQITSGETFTSSSDSLPVSFIEHDDTDTTTATSSDEDTKTSSDETSTESIDTSSDETSSDSTETSSEATKDRDYTDGNFNVMASADGDEAATSASETSDSEGEARTLSTKADDADSQAHEAEGDSSSKTQSQSATAHSAAGSDSVSTSTSAGEDLTKVPESSPVHTDGPTKSANETIKVPSSGPARDIIASNAPAIKDTYPPVPVNNSVQSQIASELMGQNAGNGSKQPVDTIHLTDQQVRTLAEAVAHNINLRRQAAAEQMMNEYYSQFDTGNFDSFGGGGAGFEATGLSNDFQEAILQLADQVVNANIPYAWGGGSLEGPSQGISDGGGYADACGDYNKIGFDCSGLVRYMFYQTTGVELPRVSQAQFAYCVPITDPQVGDIGFPGGGAPGHVYMYVGNGQIVEAQQSGTLIMYSPVPGDAVWGRPPESPNGF